MMPSIANFASLPHPFVWTTRAEHAAVLANVNDPLWGRFLAEAERHFVEIGGLRPPAFPLWCHDGDLDEVMAVAVLAYVRDDARLWAWIADWLRALTTYYRQASPRWHENIVRIMRGENPRAGNPRQFFEGFTRNGAYWVEGGFMSAVLHLFDLLEAQAPAALSLTDKAGLRSALADFSRRYAFHEEAFKYSNRGMWANGGLLCSALVEDDPTAASVLFHQAARRNEELRSTFFPDGSHGEGAPDYHLMALDGLLAYSLTASHLPGGRSVFEGKADGDDPLTESYPAWPDAVRAYLRTSHPGPVPMNHPRGCSISSPVTLRPSLLQAYRITRDPEIGWFIVRRMADPDRRHPSPLRVTPAALLGLGHYQPLMNFWLYRPVDNPRPPASRLDVLPDHGGLFSRSGWDAKASCLTARFGYEGTGKGHRDHGHVTVSAGGVMILSDPFPRFGPVGLESSMFHNTVTLDNAEPAAVIGRLSAQKSTVLGDAFILDNTGGSLPSRAYLHDPREEANSWFANHPAPAAFEFKRALFHLPGRCVVGVDRVSRSAAPAGGRIDWFWHSRLRIVDHQPKAERHDETYLMRRRHLAESDHPITITVRGPVRRIHAGARDDFRLEGEGPGAWMSISPLNTDVSVHFGRNENPETLEGEVVTIPAETNDFLRVRSTATEAHLLWMVEWTGEPTEFSAARDGDRVVFRFRDGVSGTVNFSNNTLALEPA